MNSTPVIDNADSRSRHIDLEGTVNLRDAGGYETLDGRHTHWKTLWRSDSLHHLRPEGQKTLLDLGIRTIIDLRFPSEIAQSPSVFANSTAVRYHSIPLIPDTMPDNLPIPDDLVALYIGFLDDCQAALRNILGTMLESGSAPVLVHCTAGKDRTGMVIALLLGAVGVPDATVVADYALTESYIGSLLPALRRDAVRNGLDTVWYERMLDCQPEFMAKALEYLHKRYGSAENYWRGLGFSAKQLDDLRMMLVD
ncbi:MAG TPA: tyrosine-protein phosphatase [Aggregatilineales bacterium]|nr:tyrosine-protein phosphatase [Aggregatilineales bacterium]